MPFRMARLFTVFLLLAGSAAAQEPAPPAQPQAEFSAAEASAVLDKIVEGLAGHSAKRMLSAFDQRHMTGYAAFADQVQVMFDSYDSFRVRYQIRQTATEGARGMVLADFELEQAPRDGAIPVRKQAQIRFVFERGEKQWKIVDLTPRGFFS